MAFQRDFSLITLAVLVLAMGSGDAVLAQYVAPPLHDEAELGGLLSSKLIPYSVDHNVQVFADYVPLTAETTVPFTIEMARNEYEPLQVGIYVPSGQAALSLIPSTGRMLSRQRLDLGQPRQDSRIHSSRQQPIVRAFDDEVARTRILAA